MSRTLFAVLVMTAAAAACAAAATTTQASGPSESQIVGAVSDRLAEASATMAASPAENAATAAPAQYEAPPAQYDAPPPAAVSAAMTCEIRATPTAGGVRLESFAHASGPITGSYDLVVTKSGSAGSSNINQGGEFDTIEGPSASLGASEISVEPGARVHARLTVHADNGAICHDDL